MLVLKSCASLRGAERTLSLMSTFFKKEGKAPSWYSGRFWILRLGYYKLTRQKEKADDWIWIVDHTVQWGKEKCLLILGIRQSRLPESETNLSHEDVEPLALFPVSQSNGDVVYKQLKSTIKQTGIPKQIISDHGSDVKSGIEQFCKAFPCTTFVYDITHKAATLLKRELDADERWKCFIANAASTRKKVQQTTLAAIAPPNQRSKARYMNVDTLIKWGTDKLHFMDGPESTECLDCTKDYLDEKLGWLKEFRNDLYRWKDVVTVVKEAEMFVKFQGLYRESHHDLNVIPTFTARTIQGKRIRSELLMFVKQESQKAGKNDRLLGSSEVIESVFGKMKRLEQDQAKSGFTVFILGLAAMVAETTREVVQKALETVKTSAVNEWFRKNIGKSVQARRVEVNRLIKIREQKLEHFCMG
jgi:hypothetical protein